jgi:NAD(P)-dependent dehydrogenase (short-subunit alcohol dehydrogenase family)
VTDPFGLAGRKALIVGGGQGIGESAALRLAEAGCDIAVVDLDAERAEAVAEAVRRTGRTSAALVGNVVEDGEAARLVAEATAVLGGLDIVVSIVGAAKFGSVLEMSPREWDGDHARNLRYFFFLCQAAAHGFIRRGVPGTIVGIATAGAIGSMPFRPAYGAAKAGLIHLVRTLAVELGEHHIRINAVAPGMTVTPRTATRMNADATRAEAAKIPLGRLGTSDDIGKSSFSSRQISPAMSPARRWRSTAARSPRRTMISAPRAPHPPATGGRSASISTHRTGTTHEHGSRRRTGLGGAGDAP